MNKVLFDRLNSIYSPMWNKAVEIKNKLTSVGYAASLGFFNNHYVKDGSDFAVEYFPIPVITVTEIGDVGIDIDTYWVEIHLDKNDALLLDYPELTQRYNIEVYGAEGFCDDFYNTQTDPCDVVKKINDSSEKQINVAFYLDLNSDTDEIVKIIKHFMK